MKELFRLLNLFKLFLREIDVFGNFTNWYKSKTPKFRFFLVFFSFILVSILLVRCVYIDKSFKSKMSNPKNPIVVIQTNLGTMKFELFKDKAPLTVGNFVDLVDNKFYNGLIFHRIVKNFIVQGGDPKGTGFGGPGYTIKDEFGPGLKHDDKGILSMANSGPNTGGSQFFITLAPAGHLDGVHAIFGKILDGKDVLEKIGKMKTHSSGFEKDKPIVDVIMQKVYISK